MTSLLFSLLAVAPLLVETPSDSLRINEEVTIERIKEKKIYNDGGKYEGILNEKSPTVKSLSLPFSMRSWSEVTEAVVEVTISSRTEGLGFTVREQTEIKVGDIIRAVVKNPKTKKNISESNEVEVQY